MKLIRQFAAGILLAELVVAVVLIIGLMVPLPGKVEFKIVQSGSMVPALPVGSVVTVVPAPTYRVGDIITFGADAGERIPTTHRIESIIRDGGSTRYKTKGDANEEGDNTLTSYDQVIGKVVYTVPRLGYALDFARTRKGFTYTVAIPAGLIILDELLTIYGALRGMRRRKEYEPGMGMGMGDAHAGAIGMGMGIPLGAQVRMGATSNELRVPSYELAPARIRTPHTNPASMDGIARVYRAPRPVHQRERTPVYDGYTLNLRAI